jgi:hypothetical protein
MVRDADDVMIAPETNRILSSIHPHMYDVRPGRLNIARKDKKSLLVAHVKAIIWYCQKITEEIPLPTVKETVASKVLFDECFRKRWELLRAKATREGFLAAWEEMKSVVKEKSKETDKEVVSPFDV